MIIADTPHIFMPEWPPIQTSSPRAGAAAKQASKQSHADKSMNGSLHQVFPFGFGYSGAERVFPGEEDGFPVGMVEQDIVFAEQLIAPLRAPVQSPDG
jgi:hypothetical protein